jgi:hypothetical protein
MTIDIQIMLTFYLFMLICVATNNDMTIQSFKSQISMVMMSGVGWLLFKGVQFINSFI